MIDIDITGSHPEVGCQFFPSGLRSPLQLNSVTLLRPVPSYTAWRQRHISVNNLPKVVTQLCPDGNWTYDILIASPTNCRYATAPPHIRVCIINFLEEYVRILSCNVLYFTVHVCWSIDIKSVLVHFVARVFAASCDECRQSWIAVNVYRKSWWRRKTGICWRDLVCQTQTDLAHLTSAERCTPTQLLLSQNYVTVICVR